MTRRLPHRESIIALQAAIGPSPRACGWFVKYKTWCLGYREGQACVELARGDADKAARTLKAAIREWRARARVVAAGW
jgi:hypothetical protein